MHHFWLQKVSDVLGVKVRRTKEHLTGVLIGESGRPEWRFVVDTCTTLKELCTAAQKERSTEGVNVDEEWGKERVIDIEEEAYPMFDKKQRLSVRKESLTVTPILGEDGLSGLNTKEKLIEIRKIVKKQRVCDICKSGVGEYKKIRDPFMGDSIKRICSDCHREFHWVDQDSQAYHEYLYKHIL